MIRRIWVLTGYLLRNLTLSLTGILFVLLMLGYWRVLFDPTQRTPEVAYYILVTTLFGAGATFLVTLALASRANQAVNLPFLSRLPSRVEHLAAVFVGALLYATLLQVVLGLLGLWRGPDLTLARATEIPPIWISMNALAAVLALHASELVVHGWSRVYVYGSIAVLLFANSLTDNSSQWIADLSARASTYFYTRDLVALGELFNSIGNRAGGGGPGLFSRVTSAILWPFQAITDATIGGAFSGTQALAPGLLLVYASLLFLLAATFFARKDLFLAE